MYNKLLLLLLLLLICNIPSSFEAISDSEETETIADESVQPVNQNIYNTKSLFKSKPLVTDINSVIQVELYCEIDVEYCKKVQHSLISAASRFSSVINLKNKIIIQTRYYSFCEFECSNNTYGWGTPSSQFTLISLNEADSNFIYPQALAKQLAQFTDSSNWASYDVAVDINHDIHLNSGYWFNETGMVNATQTNNTIQEDQIDIEYVILHQMIHGLGMVSSWAPYFSDLNSPFQKLLNGLITPLDSLKIMTPSPYWYVSHVTGPAYVTGFQPNLIFDKFMTLFFSAQNETISLMDYGFDMQNFCVKDQDAFIVFFMNAFLNNATQSTRAKSIYVAMSEPNTLTFQFNSTSANSTFYTNDWLNQTYKSMSLMTGPNIINTSQLAYYRPGISTSHLDESYLGTPDFLMAHQFIKGKPLDTLIEEGYSIVPSDIKYNVTEIISVNVTTLQNNTNNRTLVNITEQKEQTTEYVYRSAIGPGILRILETIGYSTVLTNTNYTTSVIKTTKPETNCDNSNNNNFHSLADQVTFVKTKSSASSIICSLDILCIICIVLFNLCVLYK